MNILGVHIGHDSSVALLKNGHLVADVAEERFTRIKHYSGVPYRSLDYCLREGGISASNVDIVAVTSKYSIPALNILFDLPADQQEKKSVRAEAADAFRKYFGGLQRMPPLYVKRYALARGTRILHVEHHLAHAGSAYYTSGLDRDHKALVVTCDGAGDNRSLCLWIGENGKISPLKQFGTKGSIGWFYSNVTEALGWIHGDGEGKTMGLAPYGDVGKCKGCLDAYYPKFAAGDLVEPHEFGPAFVWDEAGSLQFHFEEANAIRKLIDRHGRDHIAAEAQRVLEDQLLDLTSAWLDKTHTDTLCAAGGVFLNVKLNQRLWYSGKLRRHWTYPNCGDSGLAHGAALVAYFQETSGDIPLVQDLYSGPGFSNEEIHTVLQHRRICAEYIEHIEDRAAELLAENSIIGWFQGRMESGPRALGNRSILMSPARQENKDIINARVKYREGFRPFCPSVPVEHAPKYMMNYRPEPFMITSFDAAPSKKDRIPAVVHQDGTTRPQTVTRGANERYWKLLNRYGELSGDPVLLNTSMNIMGEPIAANPRDALKCFFDSGMDFLVLGNYLIAKDAKS